MLDSQHRLYFGENRRDPRFDFRSFFRRALYHIEMIEPGRRLRNAIATVCTVSSMACHVTKNVNLVENPDATSRPSQVEILTKGGSTIVVYDPVVQRDSLRGYSDQGKMSPIVLATSDIQSARTRQLSGGRTALLVTGIVATAIGALFIVAIIVLSNADFE